MISTAISIKMAMSMAISISNSARCEVEEVKSKI
jgi:hypothetical protein